MEQFSLEKYLENPNRKVVTRRGNPVRIICTDRKHGEDDLPIVFLEQCRNGEFLLACRKDGRGDPYDTPYDLFFADEELIEFEKEVKDLMNSCCNEIGETIVTDEWAKDTASALLDFARKEILKSLPKWKKAHEHKEFPLHVCVMDENMYPFLDTDVNEDEYYIELEDLKTLPKEE